MRRLLLSLFFLATCSAVLVSAQTATPTPTATSTVICSDGTPADRCSPQKPFYCTTDGRLLTQSSRCGCPAGYSVAGDQCARVVATTTNGCVAKGFTCCIGEQCTANSADCLDGYQANFYGCNPSCQPQWTCERPTTTPKTTATQTTTSTRTRVCPAVYTPVCGKDGKTYSNECEARRVETEVAYPGACRPEGAACENQGGECLPADVASARKCQPLSTSAVCPLLSPTSVGSEAIPGLPVERSCFKCPPAVQKFTLRIQPGWNFVSTPVTLSAGGSTQPPAPPSEASAQRGGTVSMQAAVPPLQDKVRVVRSTCESPTLWHYDSRTKSYIRLDRFSLMEPGRAYWFKPSGRFADTCEVEFEGDEAVALEGLELAAGWNQIGATTQNTPWEDIKGTCKATSGPWLYEASAREYKEATQLEPGQGYWVKVSEACKLGSGEPPAPPVG